MAIDEEEVASSVEKIVPGFVRYQYGALGTRDLSKSYTDFRNAVLGTLLLKDAAPFYIVKLARDRLLTYLSTVRSTVVELQGACMGSARSVQPVSRTSSLSNAQVALDALAKSMSERTGVYQSIATIPTFKRFENNVNQFLSEEGSKASYRGELADTPTQAQAKVKPLALQLRSEWDELLRLTALWATSIDEYSALSLPATLSQVIMDNASSVLSDRIDELNAMTPEQRLTVLRSLVVDLVAVKTAVKNFGSLEPPTTFLLLDGEGSVFADSTHPAIPAALHADYSGGYSVYTGKDTLKLLVDGIHALTINPPGSYVARHDCLIRGPFNIAASPVPVLMLLRGRNSGTSTASSIGNVVLPYGSAIEPWEIASAISTQSTMFLGGLYFTSPKTTQEVSITPVDSNTATFSKAYGLAWYRLGITTGYTLIVEDSESAYNYTAWTVTGIDGNNLTCDLLHGTTSATEAAVTVVLGVDEDLRYFIKLKQDSTALAERASLQVADGSSGVCAAIGLYASAKTYSYRTPAATFADLVNKSVAAATADGVPRVSATTELVDLGLYAIARTRTEDAMLVSFYYFRGDVQIKSTTSTTTVLKNCPSSIKVGHVVVIRGTNSTSDTNTWGTVTWIFGSEVTINRRLFGSTGSTAHIEAGATNLTTYTNSRKELEFIVEDETENKGTYLVGMDPCPDPLTLRLLRAFPNYIGLGGQPVVFSSIKLGVRRIVLSSLGTTLTSAIQVLGTGNFDTSLVTSVPVAVLGSTTWFQLPSVPRRLELGDYLEIYNSDPSTPSLVTKVLSIDTGNKLLEVETPIPVNQATVNFSVTNVLPFARIRKAVKQNFDDVSASLKTWLELPTTVPLRVFRELDAAINPVVANTPPSMAQASVPKAKLDTLLSLIDSLEGYLGVYAADVVAEVDSLIKGFLQKGMDRAVDVLLSGDFATFFGLSMDTSSYSGNLQYALREVQKTDYPVRKDNRVNSEDVVEEQTLASLDDVDFEYNADQLDPNQRVDIVEPNSVLGDLPL